MPQYVVGDRERLLQVLGNLVDNALKFTFLQKPLRAATLLEAIGGALPSGESG